MRDRVDEALPCNRPSTLRPFDELRDRRAQGTPLTVWLIKKSRYCKKKRFSHLYPILDWRVVVLSSELLDSVLERPTSSTLLLYTFVIPA